MVLQNKTNSFMFYRIWIKQKKKKKFYVERKNEEKKIADITFKKENRQKSTNDI